MNPVAGSRLKPEQPLDTITGLPSVETLPAAISPDSSAILLKVINGRDGVAEYGWHRFSDMLRLCAGRLREAIPATAELFRFDGDVFAIVARPADSLEAAEIAQAAMKSLAAPMVVDGRAINTAPSAGIAIVEDQAVARSELFRRAAVALAQVQGAGEACTFDVIHDQDEKRLSDLRAEIADGIRNGRFRFRYRPQLDAVREVVGLAAIQVWDRHGDRSVLSGPVSFAAVAERSGLGLSLLDAQLQAISVDQEQWRIARRSSIRVRIAVSAAQLARPGFTADFLAALESCRLRSELLTVMVPQEIADTAEVARLSSAGISLGMDVTTTNVLLVPIGASVISEVRYSGAQLLAHTGPAERRTIAAAFETYRRLGVRVVIGDLTTVKAAQTAGVVFGNVVLEGEGVAAAFWADELR